MTDAVSQDIARILEASENEAADGEESRLLRHAGELGKALLERHQNYVARAEQEREEMTTTITVLGSDKRTLETGNRELVEHNRQLLDQLEELNSALEESDLQVKSLTATLQSTQDQLRRVTILATRTEWLEKQLELLEKEQGELQRTLDSSLEGQKNAITKQKRAEAAMATLQDQIERIEREASEEKQRHLDVVGRMERRRAVERELESAAGRLKGAAAAKSAPEKEGSNVVSHFVKDILQDNANLQLGIVELREMLSSSNEEVARLREQLMLAPNKDGDMSDVVPQELPQDNETDPDRTPRGHEVHVHHHFHELSVTAKQQPVVRRVQRKQKRVTPGHFTPTQIPRGSASAAIMSQTLVTVPSRSKRWSVQSNATTASSLPGSPFTHSRRTSSVFDRVFSDSGHESSRPTSPDESELGSPGLSATHKSQTGRRVSPVELARDPVASLDETLRDIEEDWALSSNDPVSPLDDVILEEAEDQERTPTAPRHQSRDDAEVSGEYDYRNDLDLSRPMLRRAASHESLLSISGMDIHTVSQPWQVLGLTSRAAPSLALSSTTPSIAATPATAAAASRLPLGTASATMGRSQQLLSNMVANDARRSVSGSDTNATIGAKVGGWVRGRWGFAPAPAASVAIAPASTAAAAAVRPSVSGVAPAAKRSNTAPVVAAAPAHVRGADGRLVGGKQGQRQGLKAMKSTPVLPAVAEHVSKPVAPGDGVVGTTTRPAVQGKAVMLPAAPAALASDAKAGVPAGKAPLTKDPAAATVTATATQAVTIQRRPPGINQPGAIWGFPMEPPTPYRVHVGPGGLDEEALREGLGQI